MTNKRLFYGILLIITLLVIGAALFILNMPTTMQPPVSLSCKDLEKDINTQIEQANYCNVDEDCTLVGFGCPFGCGSYVNKRADVASIKTKIGSYREQCGFCEYKCIRPFNSVCKNNKCVETQALCQSDKVHQDPWECHCPEGTKRFVWLPEGKEQANLICRTITSCKGDTSYEKQTSSFDYKVYGYDNYVRVTGNISEAPNKPSQEQTIKLYPAQQFYLPIKEGWAAVRLERIINKTAHFLFTYMAPSPSCDNLSQCYTCSFTKESAGEVTITTDKTEYRQDETIEITVRNTLDKSIYYVDLSPALSFWRLERLENNSWKEITSQFQFPEIVAGREECTLIVFEIREPFEFGQNSEMSHRWNQRICLIDRQPYELKFIDKGYYRFSFTYALNRTNELPYKLLDPKTIYSDEFTIE